MVALGIFQSDSTYSGEWPADFQTTEHLGEVRLDLSNRRDDHRRTRGGLHLLEGRVGGEKAQTAG